MDMDYEAYDYEVEDYDEIEGEGEQQNRLFFILVAGLSGILLLGVAAFCVWLFLLRNDVQEPPVGLETPDLVAQVALTETAVREVEMAQTATAEVLAQAETQTAEAATPVPTGTPVVVATETPLVGTPPSEETVTPEEGTPTEGEDGTPAAETATPAGVGEVQTTPTMGPRNTPTPTTGTPSTVSDTGLGAFTAIFAAGGLILLLITARRLRAAR